ncbi:uncharacterized protein JCM10292_005444 [Rhodotorula paludigena]|uniref:uncharacterized protein n=1 Tax=Rhodotorula paludigena TaxID=86838 RepID=UPI00317AA820
MTLPNGLATVASLQLSAYFALGWGPAGPPVGFLDSLTYYVENEQLTVCIHPRWNEADLDGLRGPLYEHQPVVGFKDGIVTRPADYIGYLGTDINSYTP